jgi:hypothetical protein
MKTTAIALATAMAAGTAASAQDAVQWRVEDGGNGHWYAGVIVTGGVSWPAARVLAESVAGHLATPMTGSENEWIFANIANTPDLFPNQYGPWIGVFQDLSSLRYSEPAGGWYYVTGEAVSSGFWSPGEPNDAGREHFAHYGGWNIGSGWNDLAESGQGSATVYVRGYVVEFSADCNGDGIVDYGQILDGALIDENNNGIPDCCEFGFSCLPCPADLNNDGIVNGADISVLLGFWGLNGNPVDADITGDGLVDGADLAMLLSSWGKCQ